tara:strand:+ start:135 stop:416 length:282 start_codon:yes stop_codon:yes gene_type:complete
MNKNLYLFSILSILFGGMNVHSKADNYDSFWLGSGVAAAETLCLLTKDNYITNATANMFMSAYRTNLSKNDNFRSSSYERGIQIANDTHGCSL